MKAYGKKVLDDWSQLLHSNQAISKVTNPDGTPVVPQVARPKTMFGGIPTAIANSRRDGSSGLLKELQSTHRKADGKSWDGAVIAGSFIAAGAGYRALSGGGAYRDSNGNTNVAGIPFI